MYNEVVIEPRDNGFPGPAVALEGPASQLSDENVICYTPNTHHRPDSAVKLSRVGGMYGIRN